MKKVLHATYFRPFEGKEVFAWREPMCGASHDFFLPDEDDGLRFTNAKLRRNERWCKRCVKKLDATGLKWRKRKLVF